MADFLATADARLAAILFEGYGNDGALGVAALARSIPPQHFRRSYAPLRDVAEPVAALHRGVRIVWRSIEREPLEGSELDPSIERVARVQLEVGYLGGNANSDFVLALGIEDAATIAKTPEMVALSDAERIRAALQWPELYQVSGDDPVLLDVQREGAAVIEQVTGWLWLCTHEYRVRLWGTADGYAP